MPNIEAKIDKLLSFMTLEEKVSLCHANSKFTISGIERLGIPPLSMSDGPHGVREELERDSWQPANRTDDFGTYLPTETALAATWNPEKAAVFGKVLGEEARAREKDIILGPGINIIRHPLCGRNFEYMSEDPCLIEKMVSPLIKSIQSTDTAACVKHFALNNQELDRNFVNVEVSDRALNEIYLKGFKAAVDAGAYSFMGAYNRYLGAHCCHNEYLVNKILKGKWNFDGVYISDWAGVHDTKEAALYGTDIEMGTDASYDDYFLADPFLKLLNENEEARKALDDKVRRILRLCFRINKISPDRKKGAYATKEHQEATYEIAKEAMILLKNENNILPLKKADKILVVGENATKKHALGGNSSAVKAVYEISLLEGIKDRFSESDIEYIRTTDRTYKPISVESLDIIDLHAGCHAFRCECFTENNFKGEIFTKFNSVPEAVEGFSSYRFKAILLSEKGTEYRLRFSGENATLYLSGEKIKTVSCENYDFIYKAENEKVDIIIESRSSVSPSLLLDSPEGTLPLDELIKKAENADLVVYCGGIDHSLDCEGFDRPDMSLPEIQNIEIPALLSANKNTVIAITAGSPVEMPWINESSAVIWTWYAGMQCGNVFADILLGKINPSGKLPFTLPFKLQDHPAVRYGEYKAENCRYKEDIFVGYRGFDKDNIDPLFPFGYGLSFSSFKYSDFSLKQTKTGVDVSFKISNQSDTDGFETAEIFVGHKNPSETTPLRKLCAFKKVFLKANEQKETVISLNHDCFYDYSEKSGDFELLNHDFTIYVGSSSRDFCFKEDISLQSQKQI